MARQCCETLQIQARAPQENVIIWFALASMLEKGVWIRWGLLLRYFLQAWPSVANMSMTVWRDMVVARSAEPERKRKAETLLASAVGDCLRRLGRLLAEARVAASTRQFVATLRTSWPASARCASAMFLLHLLMPRKARSNFAHRSPVPWQVFRKRLPTRADLCGHDLINRAHCFCWGDGNNMWSQCWAVPNLAPSS